MDSAILPRKLADHILRHAQRAPEREVCGLVAAREGRPVAVYPVANVSDLPGRLFEMDPAGQVEAMRGMRERGETLYAIYHSHPAAPATPSLIDLDRAAYPDVLHLIVSLAEHGVLEMRGYHLRAGAVEPVALELVE